MPARGHRATSVPSTSRTYPEAVGTVVHDYTAIREVRDTPACRTGVGTATRIVIIVEGFAAVAPNHPYAVLIEARPTHSELGGAISRSSAE
jgi:hypothetical protein